MVNRVAGQGEVFWFRDGYVPVVRLHEVFGVEPRATQLHEGLIMVVEGEGRRVGLFVDDLLGQQQVVIKSLETNFRRVDGVSGRDDPRRRRRRADSRCARTDPRRCAAGGCLTLRTQRSARMSLK